jgi:hypothetical protein
MKNQRGRAIGACLALSLGLSLLTLGAQERPAQAGGQDKKPKRLSRADQRAIEALFKGVDPSKYRLQFNKGKRVLGTKKVEMRDLEQVKKYRNPAEAAGWIILAVEGPDDIIYILAVGNAELQSVLGKEKTAKLNQIMAKYAR